VRVQTIHFIRHAEGFHNIGWEQNDDAHLTSRGWQQAAALRRHVSSLVLPLNVQACPRPGAAALASRLPGKAPSWLFNPACFQRAT